MPGGERCRGAVCGRTACTVRQGAAGEADAKAKGTRTRRATPGGLPPKRTATDQPAAYLTGSM
jgi:hypothetical protein